MKLQEQDVFAGRYRLLRRIGSGGFSVVWLAADQMTEDSEVALKIYVPEKGMDSQGIKMFVREYKIVADMNHSGLLKAMHFDVHDGSPFLVMPFCSAGSLHSRMMERGAIPEGEIADVLEQTAGALAYLHREEVVHQDIKPDNVLINDRGEYLLTDFGISSRMRSTMRKSTGRKESMTVAYAPPERFGSKQETLASGDLFSLGVMIYELATGELPWMGMGGSVLSPDQELPELPKGYSRSLEQLMHACMSYSPADRPTAEEVKAAASSYRSSGRWGAVSGRKRKGGSLWWLWVLVALVVLGGGYGVYTMMESGMGPVPEPGPVVVDSASVEEDTVDNDSDEFREADGYDGTEEDEQAAETSAWAAAERSDTKGGYEGYLEDYPDGAYAREAEMKLEEIAEEERMDRERRAETSAWYSAERRNTITGYEAYLTDYPDGAHVSEAREALKELELAVEAERTAERMAAENRITKKRINNLENVYGDEFDYFGDARKNTPHGYGTASYSSGSKYVGEWKDGEMEGQGTFSSADGSTKYVGEWKDGEMEGQGTLTVPSGSKYVGEWKDGKKEGHGTLTLASGVKYVGEWKNGRREGQGTFTLADGSKYVGEWKNGEEEGQGTLTYSNGDKYVGEWKDGEMEGQGTYFTSEGTSIKNCLYCRKYKGGWSDGKKHGFGRCYDKDGKLLYEGRFKDGHPVESYPNR